MRMGLRLWLVFEAIGNQEKGVEDALDQLISNLKEEKGITVTSEEYDELKKVENPHPNIEEGYSKIAELNVECNTFTKAVKTVVNYGPTYVQIEGPDDFNLELKDSQEALQEVANTVQQYARMGVGGVLVSKTNQE